MANGFGALHVGASGLRGAQNGLNVVANNIANVDTTGYVRQQVVYEDKTYIDFNRNVAISKMQGGLGVDIGDVVHTRDMFLDQAYRTENGHEAFYSVSYEAAEEVVTLLDQENSVLGIAFNNAIEDLYSAFAEFSNDPASEEHQNLIVQKADLFISRAQAVYEGMTNYQRNVNTKINNDIDRINELGKTIHELNLKIQAVEAGNVETAMDLRDARDQALDELSGLASISYYELPNSMVKVKLEGTDFVIESRAYEIGKLTDPVTGFVTPYWEVLSDPNRNDYYEVFDVYNSNPTKNTDIGEVKALLLARGERYATYMDLLNMDYSDSELSMDKTMYPGGLYKEDGTLQDKQSMSAYGYQNTVANSIMLNEESEIDTLIHDLVTAINNLVSPITDYNSTDEGAMLTHYTVETNAYGKDIRTYDYTYVDDETAVLEAGQVCFYDTVSRKCLTADEVEGMIVFDESRACVGNDYNPVTGEGLPPKELFSRVGTERYRVIQYTYVDQDGEEHGGSMYVYNEEGVPREYNDDYEWKDENGLIHRGGWLPDTTTCYTISSLSINGDIMNNPALLAHRHQNDDIAYDLGESIYQLWEATDSYLNPADTTPCSYMDFYTKMIGELATVGSVYKTASDNLEATKQSIENNRQAVIGVSTDEELQTMIKYQNAYNASSRYMNVVSEMIETLINSMGA
ncbi:MAG: flagellar hook-associated protein FlgK [Lachnospiraceae bacterium]|nr:flagellar hook-associated protein FlgK [Lachnospiraceae bacterium]